MAVTQAQARQAHEAAVQLLTASQTMLFYTTGVLNLFEEGFTTSVGGETFPIPQDAQDRLIDIVKYQALKANLVTAFNLLP